ncbi:hypothetical protein N9F44_02895, partial [Akkermansiaceae bacterium]|nr:hypothetical protein [Akkermansiaceae bacterium]
MPEAIFWDFYGNFKRSHGGKFDLFNLRGTFERALDFCTHALRFLTLVIQEPIADRLGIFAQARFIGIGAERDAH